MYGAQNEGDGRGMVEKWWKRLGFSELGELGGRWVCKTIGLHWFNLGLNFGGFRGGLGLHWFTCGRLWFVWLCSCLCGFYFCAGMRRGMEEMWAVIWGCVDVIWAVWLCSWFMWTIPLFAGGLAFSAAVLAFSAAYFGVVVEVVL